jgi:hypothetical protein
MPFLLVGMPTGGMPTGGLPTGEFSSVEGLSVEGFSVDSGCTECHTCRNQVGNWNVLGSIVFGAGFGVLATDNLN